MQDKPSLRRELLRRRDSIPPQVRRAKSRLIEERLFSLDEVRSARVLFVFASFRSEVDTAEVIKRSLSEGKRVVLPKVDRELHKLLLYEIKSFEELSAGFMGIPEPSVVGEDRAVGIDEVDVAVVPGAGFDMSGNRIGYGGGYYDMLLSGHEKLAIIAPAYEEQITDSVPREPHDVKVGTVVTDRRIIRT